MSEAPAKPALWSVAGLIVLVALILAIAAAKIYGLVETALAAQGIGCLFSVLMIGAGNVLPREATSPQAASRIAGWILVLGGLASLVLWLVAPQDMRIPVASATALTAFAVAILAAVLHFKRGSAAGRRGHHSVLHILHGLMWAFAILLAAFAVGGQAVVWMSAAFSVSMSLLLIVLGRPQPNSH